MADYDSSDMTSTLIYIRQRFGAETFSSGQRVVALFNDLAPGLKRDMTMLRKMASHGILADLYACSAASREEQRRTVARCRLILVEEEFIRGDVADQYLDVVASVLFGQGQSGPQTGRETVPASPKRETAGKETVPASPKRETAGQVEPQSLPGEWYRDVLASAKNRAEELQRYKAAADRGDGYSAYQLAVMYANGDGVARDDRLSYQYFCTAAKAKYSNAYKLLADCCFKGTGTEPDYMAAYTWYKKAAESGDSSAYVMLALMHNENKLLASGADVNQIVALDLMLMLEKDERTEEQIEFAYLKEAASGSVSKVYGLLGAYYEDGIGTPVDYKQAFSWYQLGESERDGILPQKELYARLGRAYYYGRGTSQNYASAVSYLTKAYQAGDTDSAYLLGMCYKKGLGTAKNKTQAKQLLRAAADAGNAEARKELKKLFF